MATAGLRPHIFRPDREEPRDDFLTLPASGADQLALLHKLLGVPACRHLGIYPIPEGTKVSVVIPVYNEERWIREVIRRVKEVPIPKEIIIVDDASTDGT